MNLIKTLLIIFIFSTLSACANLKSVITGNSVDTNNENSATQTEIQDPKAKIIDFDQDKDTLFDLLVAEVAAQRNQFPITLLNYIQQAHMTRDPEIVKRAINAAQYSKDIEAIKEMALLWAEIEPNNLAAHQLLAFQYFYAKDYASSFEEVENVLNLQGDPRLETLALGTQNLTDEEKKEILGHFLSLKEKFPTNRAINYSLAHIYKHLKELDQALIELEPALKGKPEIPGAIILKTNLLYDQGKLDEAITFAGKAYKKNTRDHNLGRLYASMLVENKRLDEAEDTFQGLIDFYPQAPSLKLSLGLVKLENKKIDEAKEIFQELLNVGHHPNEAHFYLGRIADQDKKIDEAINHYKQIKESPNYDTAIERISLLLAQQNKKEELLNYLSTLRQQDAKRKKMLWLLEVKLLSLMKDKDHMMLSLNKAIADFPTDDQLLYARAMNLESQGDLAGMETDLKVILEHQPENAIALNALGYTLADKTERLSEAFALIQKAHTLDPENPAILDSMGWVLFKLHKREEALIYLLKAFQAYQDGEVAAHLGEVLWSLNQKTEAFEVWFNVLLKQPEHPILLETIERLAPDALKNYQESLKHPPAKEATSSEETSTNETQNTPESENQNETNDAP